VERLGGSGLKAWSRRSGLANQHGVTMNAAKFMRLKNSFVAIGALIISLLQARTAPVDEQLLSAADNTFAFRLLQQIAKDQPGADIFISPYSAATILQMVGNGAAGQTEIEMRQVLGTTGLSSTAIGAANQVITTRLRDFDTNVMLTTANAVWYQRSFSVRPEFFSDSKRFFDATIAPLNFADPHSVEVINDWASGQTHGKITRLADGMIDPVNTRLFLANAVYFKGKWADPFEPKQTKDRPFHLVDGSAKNVPMMTKTKTFTYRRGTGYQAVRLPYENESLAMYVFLPDTNSSPEKLLGLMNGDTWKRITKPGFSEKEGTLVLPRFKLEYEVELNHPLEELGMKSAFDPLHADFSGIGPQLFISAARQKTFVEVKEEGTEAAAVTGLAVSANAKLTPLDPFRMIVDRPFLFLIDDKRTGVILFMGVVFDPHAD
jgi:serine protease inhibitor